MKKNISLLVLLGIALTTYSQNQFDLLDSIQLYASSSSDLQIDSTYHVHVYRFNSTKEEETKLPNINEWNYVAVTKDGLIGKMYFNGELVQERMWQDVGYSLSSLWIGRNQYWRDYYFKGWLDEFRMSNVAKTPEEISNHYNSNKELTADANTIGLWHFNESDGNSFANEAGGSGTLYGSPVFTEGKFANAIYFDGTDDYGNCNVNPPENNRTIEFWIKFDGFLNRKQSPIMAYGSYAVGYNLIPTIDTVHSEYIWSTGDTANFTTVNPNIDTLVWVKQGDIVDTLLLADKYRKVVKTSWINDTITVMDTTFVTVVDSISVTDTLIIDAVLTDLAPPFNTNTIKVYPNPAKDHVYINTGDYAKMNGYRLKIISQLGSTVFETSVEDPIYEVNLSEWSGMGLYFLQIIDNGGKIIDIRKIILQ